MTRRGGGLLLVCLVAFAGALLPQQGRLRHYGKRITAIYFEPKEQPVTRDQLGISLRLHPGDILTEEELGRSIENLWATGRYSDVVATVEESEKGVELTFHTQPAFFTGRVTVEGVPEPPNPAQSVNTTQMNLGEPFDPDLLPLAVDRLLDLLKSNGFYNSSVRYETQRLLASEEVLVRFIVEPGVRSRFLTPAFEGDLRFTEKKLIRRTGWDRWYGLRGYREVTQSRVQSGLDRIRSLYLKGNYLSPIVRLKQLEYDPTSGNIRPHLDIQAGSRVTVTTEGAKVSGGQLRQLIPIYQERTIDNELLGEGALNLKSWFESKGYFEVKVGREPSTSADGTARTIRYQVDLGPRYRLSHVSIKGNRYFDTATIAERLTIVPASFPRYRRGVFSPAMLEQDRAAIEALYVSNGFNDAVVTAGTVRGWRGKATDVDAAFEIKEGDQWLVEDLEMSGVDLQLVERVQSLVSSSPGQPYSLTIVAADRDAILNYYFNNGYPDAGFDAEIIRSEKPNRVRLKYKVREGRRVFVRDVLVSGLVSTRRNLVTSRLLLSPMQPLSQSALVETQRRLYDLGIFAKVDVAVQNPEGRERAKYVLLQVEEARKYSLNLGWGAEFGRIGGSGSFDSPAGANAFSPRGLIGITRSNMFGVGHTAGITFRASSIQQRAVVNYIAPQWSGNPNLSLSETTLVDQSKDIQTYTSRRAESALQLSQSTRRALAFQHRLTARFVFVDDLKLDPNLIPIYSRPVKTLSWSSGLIFDRRDDPIDSTKGFYQTLEGAYAFPFALSSTHFTRISARNSTYTKIKRDLVFARSVGTGWIHNLRSDPLPLPENYYGGGASTHRGFPDNQAGPRDLVTGFPIGGQAFLFFNHELRFPLIAKSVAAVLFHDMGNVYTDYSMVSFRYKQRDDQDFDYMVQAVGLGFRFKTPIGPIRFDVAFAPNTPRFVGFEGSYDDLINGKGRYGVPQRVSRFQFHFSIGQAF